MEGLQIAQRLEQKSELILSLTLLAEASAALKQWDECLRWVEQLHAVSTAGSSRRARSDAKDVGKEQGMEQVIVERTFPEPMDVARIEDMKRNSEWCREQNRVRYLHAYLSPDRRRMICVYEAPDAESVRRYNRQAALPYDAIWTAVVIQ